MTCEISKTARMYVFLDRIVNQVQNYGQIHANASFLVEYFNTILFFSRSGLCSKRKLGRLTWRLSQSFTCSRKRFKFVE
jgi:hypothetical protein